MLLTPIGLIKILINEEALDYQYTELTNKAETFKVDKRYQIKINLENKQTSVKCILDLMKSSNALLIGPESGEKLVLISFLGNNFKLSIGVEGDIPGVSYEYLKHGISIDVPGNLILPSISCNIAWLKMNDIEREEAYTWFAADPTLTQ